MSKPGTAGDGRYRNSRGRVLRPGHGHSAPPGGALGLRGAGEGRRRRGKRGVTTPIRVRPVTSRHICTRSPSRRTPNGPASTRPRPRSTSTCAAASHASASASTSSTAAGHRRPLGRGSGPLDRRHTARLDQCAGPRVASGPLSQAKKPDLPGLGAFEGPVFHSAEWDHGVSLAGRRVAVVGTGASAIQIVPAIAGEVAHLSVFQRTPPWIIPRKDKSSEACSGGCSPTSRPPRSSNGPSPTCDSSLSSALPSSGATPGPSPPSASGRRAPHLGGHRPRPRRGAHAGLRPGLQAPPRL